LAVPRAETSGAAISALNCVLLIKVVARSCPFNRTAEAGTKPEPVTVRIKLDLGATLAEGDKELSAGTGFMTVTVAALEASPSAA
jgi:hypothetical protein